MPFFKNVFKSKEGPRSSSRTGKYADNDTAPVAQAKPRWEDAWSRKEVAPEEIQELIHVCTQEMKSRALDQPFMLLPFRLESDPSAARNFVRNFFRSAYEGTRMYTGEALHQELRLTEPLVLCSIIKWCWSRLPGGVVSWDAYELFRIGESDSNFAVHAFDTFIPLSVDSEARRQIIVDFFDLLAAVAARGKSNGMGGRKLSRMAGWWAFAHTDEGMGFDGGYRTWTKAADAASHLFFAYLRSLAPDPNIVGGISTLPRSLQALLSQTEYPPQAPLLMQTTTTKVVMIVDSVSPTPFALLRRAKHFEYRDDDEALQRFSSYEDPVRALTDECRRVLECISSTNQSAVAVGTALGGLGTVGEIGKPDPSWSQFADMGFSGLLDSSSSTNGTIGSGGTREFSGARSRNNDFGRPTTPSWADFLSSGFADENGPTPSPFLLPPDKILPPIGEASRVHSSQSHVRHGLQTEHDLEPGELASITQFDLDDTFWWVWMTSLAAEEPSQRKAVFGRCTLIETRISGAKWLVMEEQVKGAAAGPEEGAYIAEKKGRFSFRTRLGRRKSTGKKPASMKEPYNRTTTNTPMSKTSIGPDQQARVQAAAARLAQKQRDEEEAANPAQRRARMGDGASVKTNSVLTLQPNLISEAAAAMKWDNKFGEGAKDRDALRAQYLGDINAGKGSRNDLLAAANGGRGTPTLPRHLSDRDLPSLPKSETGEATPSLAPPPPMREMTPSPAPPTPIKETMPMPSPAPLPPAQVPGAVAEASQKAQAYSAAQIPLPAKNEPLTPAQQPMSATALDEKPAVPEELLNTHPALRKPIPERKPIAAAKQSMTAEERQITTIEATKRSPPKKLKKHTAGGGGGGWGRFFGKKKADTSVPTESAHDQPTVAPYVPPAETGRYTPQPERNHSVSQEPVPTYEEDQIPVRAQSPEVEPSAAVSAVSLEYRQASYPTESRQDVHEQQEASQAFSRFDQGPMDDMPAFVPDDSDGERTPGMPHYQRQEAHYGEDVVTPTNDRRPRTPTRDDVSVSEESVDLGYQMSPSMDRWAQIRKNAAERAARLSEEQTRRSRSHSARTDEGETSGEETIESRVARIKARVAELTGNVDGQPVGR